MRILIICSQLWPERKNNANLILKVADQLCNNCNLAVLSVSEQSNFPCKLSLSEAAEVQVYSLSSFHFSPLYRFKNRLFSALLDRKGMGEMATSNKIAACAKLIWEIFPYDAIIATIEPFSAAASLLHLPRNIPYVVYIMDPTIYARQSGNRVRYRIKKLGSILSRSCEIITTPFIKEALIENGYKQYSRKISAVGFPLIEHRNSQKASQTDSRIHLLFCGWLYSDIRSPKYFLDILSRLDGQFVVTFMGRECEKLTERYDVRTGAELITLPQQPYETALQAMADADILINIGNSVPVHMPSKTLEYINTGKPFVNFYKLDDCPTLYYTKRYPLCLNLSEKDSDVDAAAKRFIDYCVENKGKTVDRDFIEKEYAECTPAYIAQIILDVLGEKT